MARINARKKGAAGERELCDWLAKNFELVSKPTRNLDQTREGGADVLCYPFAFEVKRVENLDVLSAWAQVKNAVGDKNGKAFNLEPVLAYRKNGEKWTFCIDAKHIGIDLGWVTLTEKAFIRWVKKFLKDIHLEIGQDGFHKLEKDYGQETRFALGCG